MVSNAGGYYGPPFKGYRGGTQGDHLLTTLFNIVVETVMRHWVTVMEEEEAGLEGL